MFENLNDSNYLIYAIKAYDKPNCIMSELEEDIKRIKYVKRLFKKYKAANILKDRLILNHLIILNNVFGPEAATRLLFLKIDESLWCMLKTFLLLINTMPDVIYGINDIKLMRSLIQVSDVFRHRSISSLEKP